ncbi:molybdenum cofactor-independent xanthine hydroxylase subunit HpxD [Microbacterium sediminicola]|uniref:Molybdenum cofactor-independent xanthine hydroxylase subunit HpxD n=1 Tax=Microbacterium sediminicola TaxID=415210 RepID=A0ABP4UL34_9MICO
MSQVDQFADLESFREARHEGPTHLVISEHPLFRRFWYAIGFSSEFEARPERRRVLSQDIVVWRPSEGAPVSVAYDRCGHRDAPLSLGEVVDCRLVCMYHGWEWDADGTTQRIPQFPDSRIPVKSSLRMVNSDEKYGMVWVCLADDEEGGPIAGIPPLPEYSEEGWRVIPERAWEFECSAMHLLENNFDPGHVSFVHANSFGDRNNPELTDGTAERTDYGILMKADVPVRARPGETGESMRISLSKFYAPFFGSIRTTFPDGLVQVMVKAITPIDDFRSVNVQIVLRNDKESDMPASKVLAFDDVAEDEDKVILNSLPKEFPIARHLNAHAHADRTSLAIRAVWQEMMLGRFVPTYED